MDRKYLNLFQGITLSILISAGSASASEADVDPGVSTFPKTKFLEGCLVNVGLENLQAMKNMARKFGPETLLDMMFSAVNPEFQAALLSRTPEQGKPVNNIEDMLQNEYVQHAITVRNGPIPWVKVRLDGRIFPVASSENFPQSGKGWLRQPTVEAKNNEVGEFRKNNSPSAFVLPRRY